MRHRGGRAYVTSISAPPESPTRFDNVFPVVYVADLAGTREVRDGRGTVNLAKRIIDAIPSPTADKPRFLPGDLADLDCVPESQVAYAVGRAGDVMLRAVAVRPRARRAVPAPRPSAGARRAADEHRHTNAGNANFSPDARERGQGRRSRRVPALDRCNDCRDRGAERRRGRRQLRCVPRCSSRSYK
jgi:hypothetical protein